MTVQCGSAEPVSSVHQLKVALEGTKPPVWRRLVVPSDVTLGSLHEVIQAASGWDDMHLHAFEDRLGGRYAPPGDLDIPVLDEEEAVLAEVLPGVRDRMDYTYDFGDDWLHRITVEAVRPAQDGEGEYAVCAGGRRAMPDAEDLGGVWGLAGLMERYTDGERPSATVVRDAGQEWVEYDGLRDEVLAGLYEENFDPAAFEPAELTTGLAEVPLRRGRGVGRGRSGGRRGRGVAGGRSIRSRRGCTGASAVMCIRCPAARGCHGGRRARRGAVAVRRAGRRASAAAGGAAAGCGRVGSRGARGARLHGGRAARSLVRWR
ncbi:plasmid pRiA4b ORF-3 family protein [Streptomyces griseorubiginosus]|uniref:plasmid pRiA4b ORF-3 family protein n=1 Tax=Streptomyces griseorubiginosus TaxID=67304 RepID=UPI00367CCCEB